MLLHPRPRRRRGVRSLLAVVLVLALVGFALAWRPPIEPIAAPASSSFAPALVQRYRCMRGEDAIMECDEVRIFAARRDGEPTGIRAVAPPDEIRRLCA